MAENWQLLTGNWILKTFSQAHRNAASGRLQELELGRLLFELVAEIGVGDLDQRLGPLSDGLPMQTGDAELGADVVDMVASGRHSGARLEHCDDSADAGPVAQIPPLTKGDYLLSSLYP